jgi:uncharacterized membrane protein YgcG
VVKVGLGSRVSALFIAAAIAAGIGAPAARADEAAALYDPGTVWVIHLTLPQASEDNLEAEPDEYQPGEFSIAATTGTPGSEGAFSTPVKTEVRLKGSASFQNLSGKSAFKLKFKKGERPFGLKKLTLNNMIEDTSMTHETLAYEVAREAGVPAPRTGFAYVYVNGRNYGMHLDLETYDDQALERIFGTPFDAKTQHLYEGEDGIDVIPGEAYAFQIDEGEEGKLDDLDALIDAVNGSGAEPWSTRVAPVAELTEMSRMWAMEKYVGQWDGYAGQVEPYEPNNYYLYDDTHGVFQMLPSGMDEAFMEEHHLPFDGPAGLMFSKCIEDAACAVRYWHSLSAVTATAKGLDLASRATALDAMLAPWQVQEQGDGRFHFTRAEAHAAATETGQFATTRVGEAEAWLAAHEPPEDPGEETGGGSEETGGGSGGEGTGGGGSGGEETGGGGGSQGEPPSTGQPTAPAAASGSNTPTATGGDLGATPVPGPAARLGHLGERGAALSTTVMLDAPAAVSQRATFALDGRRHLACSLPATEQEAGPVVLRCPLLPDARRHLQDGPLRLHVLTTVHADTGATTKLPRLVELRRWPTHPSSS